MLHTTNETWQDAAVCTGQSLLAAPTSCVDPKMQITQFVPRSVLRHQGALCKPCQFNTHNMTKKCDKHGKPSEPTMRGLSVGL